MAKGEKDYMETNDNAFTTYGRRPSSGFRGKMNTGERRKSRKQRRREIERDESK